jgi:SAM-dependent methyltransferase
LTGAALAASSSARFFDAIARKYDRVYARSREEMAKSLAWLLSRLPAASDVLDLGVGTGRELPALLDAGHRPVGLDISGEMLALCSRRARPIPLVQADLWGPLPFEAGTFDAVVALHGTLAHPSDAEGRSRFPREVARVLRPGGVFVAEMPTLAWLEGAARESEAGATRVDCEQGGRGSFVDDATGAKVDIWLASPEEWTQGFDGLLDVTVDAAGAGEMRIVGVKARMQQPR